MSNKKIYYEYDFSTETSVGIEYEKYLYQSQSKYQKIDSPQDKILWQCNVPGWLFYVIREESRLLS